MTTEHKTIENWFVGQVDFPDELIPTIPVIRGFVDGQFTNLAPLLWFDLVKKVAMTDKDVYVVGKPNQPWLMNFLAGGHCINDLEIKDAIH
jgi:hypothetical protein